MNISTPDLILCLGVILALSILVFLRLNFSRAALFALSLMIYSGFGFLISGSGASGFRVLLLVLSCAHCLIYCQQFVDEEPKWWKGVLAFLPLLLILASFYPAMDLNFLMLSLILPKSLIVIFFADMKILQRAQKAGK